MNVQFAVKDGEVYVLEVNPRASRTVPFVSKATGRPLAKIAAQGDGRASTLDELGIDDGSVPTHVAVKESRCSRSTSSRASTPSSGPEMRSTGEVMGIAMNVALAFGKSLAASGFKLPDRRARCSSASRTTTRRRPASSRGACATWASRSSPPAARRRRSSARASRPSASTRCSKARRTSSTRIGAGDIQLVINTTQGTKAIARQLLDPPQRAARPTSRTSRPCPPPSPWRTRSRRAPRGSAPPQVRSLQEWHHKANAPEPRSRA